MRVHTNLMTAALGDDAFQSSAAALNSQGSYLSENCIVSNYKIQHILTALRDLVGYISPFENAQLGMRVETSLL